MVYVKIVAGKYGYRQKIRNLIFNCLKDINLLLTNALIMRMSLEAQTLYLAKLSHIQSSFQDGLSKTGRIKSFINLGKIEHNVKFRKLLEGKTQVYPGHSTDAPDRSIHTNNARNLVREICVAAGLNYFIAEAVALAHDLGHCAFGHAGEKKLNELLKVELGGFDHKLAGAYIAKRILNYPNYIVEGIALHSGTPFQVIKEKGFLSVARREIWNNIDLNEDYKKLVENKRNHASYLETALISFIDEFEYLGTDLETAFRRGVLSPLLLPESFKKMVAALDTDLNPLGNPENDVKAVFLNMVMSDLKKNIKRNMDKKIRVLELSPDIAQMIKDLKEFADTYIYRSSDQAKVDEARKTIMDVCFNFIKKYKYNDFEGLSQKQRKEAAIALLIEDILYKDDKDMYELFLSITSSSPNAKKLAVDRKNVLAVFKKYSIMF